MVNRNEKPENISALLETLYREEGLSGLILLGEVPIPTVEKEGVTFKTLFPYIDFDSKSYVFDSKPGEEKYIENPFSLQREPEIWGGVINPPAEKDSSEYNSLLIKYLNKAIKYHNGEITVEKKINYLDFDSREKLGEPSGTGNDYLDKSLTNILYLGRYDLNFYERYKDDVEKIEECGKGFVPVTINVVKALASIRPWDPETLEYLMTPLVFIPPIPLEAPEIPTIDIPSVPDIKPLTDLTTKIPEATEKIPDPAMI